MGLFNLGGGSAGPSLQLPESDGYLVNIGGNPGDGRAGRRLAGPHQEPRSAGRAFAVRGPPLAAGEARDLDLATTGDKPIRIEAFMSVFREIIVGLTTDTPVGCVASIWTGPNKTGDKLTDLSADNLSTLVSWKAMLPVIVPDLPRVCDYIYLNVEKASANPCLISVLVYGRVIIANEETGLVP